MAEKKSRVATCPDCGEGVPVEGAIELGKKVTCPTCDAKLEVVETIPLELDWVFEDTYYEEEDE